MTTQEVLETDDIYSGDRFVYFDVETIPSQNKSYLAELANKIRPPGTIKKQETIDKWLAENRESAAADLMARTSFDGGRGHVCTIAWAKNNGEIFASSAATIEQEGAVIANFFNALDPYHSEILVGHNITGFDIGFLRKRAVSLGIEMPPRRTFPRDPKPWDKSVNDTMTMWAGGTGKISMDALCRILGIKGKDGFDGSMVADAWANGQYDKIAEYCKDDIWRTREIHKRFLAAGW